MLRILIASLSVIALTFVTGCNTTVQKETFVNYVDAPLVDCPDGPAITATKPGNKDTIKLIILPGDDGLDALAKSAKLGASMSRSVEHLFGGRGGLEIIDSALAPKLVDAIRLVEMKGSAQYTGPKVANYVIKPVVSKSEYGANYVDSSELRDKKGKVTGKTPAGYRHSATIIAGIRIYEIPSLKLVTTVNVTGTDGRNADTSMKANDSTGMTMLRAAGDDAVSNGQGKAALLNVFATSGKLVAKRIWTEKKVSLFLINLGIKDGLKPGEKVGIYAVRKNPAHAIDNSIPETEEVQLAMTTVSMNLTENTAWVSPIDEKRASLICAGALAKQEFNSSNSLTLPNPFK